MDDVYPYLFHFIKYQFVKFQLVYQEYLIHRTFTIN